MSDLEEVLAEQMHLASLPGWQRNYRFALPARRLEFDFAWPELKLAIEVEGGLNRGKKGGHTSKAGVTRDIEKGNLAHKLGWKLYRVTSDMVHGGEALRLAQEILEDESYRRLAQSLEGRQN